MKTRSYYLCSASWQASGRAGRQRQGGGLNRNEPMASLWHTTRTLTTRLHAVAAISIFISISPSPHLISPSWVCMAGSEQEWILNENAELQERRDFPPVRVQSVVGHYEKKPAGGRRVRGREGGEKCREGLCCLSVSFLGGRMWCPSNQLVVHSACCTTTILLYVFTRCFPLPTLPATLIDLLCDLSAFSAAISVKSWILQSCKRLELMYIVRRSVSAAIWYLLTGK